MESSPNLFSRVAGWPIIGQLCDVPTEALREARKEVVSATIYATMPFWFLPLVGSIVFLKAPNFWTGVENGELFVYGSTLVGPLAYIITKRHGRFKVPSELEDNEERETPLSYPFPYGQTSFYLATLLCIMSGFVFTVQRLKSLSEFKNIDFINETGLVWPSVFVALISTILLFCVTAYRNMLEELDKSHSDKISKALPRQEAATFERWMEVKRDG